MSHTGPLMQRDKKETTQQCVSYKSGITDFAASECLKRVFVSLKVTFDQMVSDFCSVFTHKDQ